MAACCSITLALLSLKNLTELCEDFGDMLEALCQCLLEPCFGFIKLDLLPTHLVAELLHAALAKVLAIRKVCWYVQTYTLRVEGWV
jgi:hypothetical protein